MTERLCGHIAYYIQYFDIFLKMQGLTDGKKRKNSTEEEQQQQQQNRARAWKHRV